MNHVYRTVFNRALGVWQAVAETARGHAKGGGRGALLVAVSLSPGWALALPEGGQVAAGSVGFELNGATLNLRQHSQNAVVNWQDFSIGRGERVSVHQPSDTAAMLARVQGKAVSRIDGSLEANGRFYLVNRNGVIVGTEGVINAAGFMATTLDIRDDEFMKGEGLRFFGDSRAGIVNLGSIQAESGNVALVAHSVRNDGAITASNGAAELLAGQEVFLASPDAPALLVSLGEDGAPGETGVANNGLIEAAQARMQAADGNLYALAINQGGVIRATGVETKGGRILLTAAGGTVRQDGALSARDADGSGGEILVGGDFQGETPAVANASNTIVTANARMDASATAAKGDGGRVIVWADDSTSFAGRIAARGGEQGGDGGFVEVSGKRTLDFRPDAPIDLAAKKGKTGTVLLDPDEMTVVDAVTGVNQIAAAELETLLASANYTISTSSFDPQSGSGDITISHDLSWATANTLKLESGNAINIDANITAAAGALELYAAREAEAPGESGLPNVYGGATLAAGKTITVDRLRYGVNASSLPQGGYTPDTYAESFEAYGNLRVNTLELDLSGGETGLRTHGSNNAIGAFRTLGSGAMGWVDITNHSGDLSLYLNSIDAFGLQIATPGNLTLEAGSQLTSTWGDIVLASTGGNFINQAGGGALGFTRPGSGFLIYTGTQAGTVKGGLAGTDEFSRTFAGNPPDDYTDGVSRFLYRAAFSPALQELTYRADDLSRHYGNANPGFTYSVSGLQNGDLLQNVVTGAPLLSTTATLQSGVGQYAINISQGTLASASYGFQFINGTLTVNAAPLIIDINSFSRYYGDFNPAFSATASGLKNGDSLADALAGFSLISSATRASGIGGYAITANRNADDVNANYSLTFNPGTLTINPTPITLTLNASSMVYGSALPDFRTFATLSGTYNGDTLATAFPAASFTTAATSASSVGSYAVNAASGFSNPNYQLSIGSLGALSITRAPLVINANNASRLYGDANPEFSIASVTGWKNGDTLDAILPGLVLASSATASSNAGGYAIVPTGSATNYAFVAGSGTLAVNKAPVDVYLDAASRYYGDADPQFTATYQGLKNGETALPGLSLFSDTSANTPVGTYHISLGGSGTFQNYAPTFHGGVLTIAPRPLTVTGNTATRTYGGENPALSVAVSNAMPWDVAQAAAYWIAGTEAGQRSDAGSYAITPVLNPYGNPFDNLANYAITYQPGTLNVLRAPLTVVAQPISIIWGDGRPPLQYSVSGFMSWDSADTVGRVLLTSQAGGTNVAPGLYAITAADANVGNNYRVELSGSPMIRVLPRPIVIVGNYAAPLSQIQQINPGQIEPFTVKRYDSNGNELSYLATAPLAGGPQFSVLASTDGTRGGDLFSYVGLPFIQPAADSSMDEVLRYYDITSRPGTALVSGSHDNNLINRDWQPSQPESLITIDQSNRQLNLTQPPTYEIPPMGALVSDAFPDNRTLIDELQSLFDRAGKSGPDADAAKAVVDAMSDDVRIYLNAAMKNKNGNQWYEQTIAETEQWLANLAKTQPRPDNYDVLVAKAQADIILWREEMNANPSMDGLRQKLAAGDADTVKALMPIITGKLMRDAVNGTLTPDAENALVRLINQQRYEVISTADAEYEGILKASEARGLHNIYSTPKIRDIIGDASIAVTGDQMKQAELLGGVVAAGIGSGAAVAGATLGVASLVVKGSHSLFTAVAIPLKSTSIGTYTAGAGGVAAGAAPAIAAVIAAAIGTAEAIRIVESTNNYNRYIAYKENNPAINTLQGLDMNNPDHSMQLITAISAMTTASLGKQP